MQSAEMLLTVPKEYLKAPGGFNPNVTMFFSALSLITLSTCGYWLWSWPDWICFSANVLAYIYRGQLSTMPLIILPIAIGYLMLF